MGYMISAIRRDTTETRTYRREIYNYKRYTRKEKRRNKVFV